MLSYYTTTYSHSLALSSAGRGQRRVLSGSDAEWHCGAAKQDDSGSLLLAAHRQSLLQRTLFHAADKR